MSENVILGDGQQGEASAMFTHRLRPGCEPAYLAWRKRLRAVQEKSPGYLGLQSFDPASGQQGEWVAIVRYSTPEALNRWLDSPERAASLRELDSLVEKWDVYHLGSGFADWFRSQAGKGNGALLWKQALAVLFALYPTVMVSTLYIQPHLPFKSLAARLLVSCILSVSFLNWIGMGLVNRMLKKWLARGPKSAACEYGTTAGLLVGLAIFFAIFEYVSA